MAADTFHQELMHEFDPELHHPEHVYHSAEQPPPRVPHAFDERYEMHPMVGMYYQYPKYHAQGSHHPIEDWDMYSSDAPYRGFERDIMGMTHSADVDRLAAASLRDGQKHMAGKQVDKSFRVERPPNPEPFYREQKPQDKSDKKAERQDARKSERQSDW